MATNTAPENASELLERLGKLSAAVASLGLIASVFYDWGFLAGLGLRFSEAPTLLSDHVRSWIIWLPTAAIAAVGYLVYHLFFLRVEHGKSEEEIVKSAKNPLLTQRFRDGPFYLLMSTAVVIVVSWVLFGDRFREGFGFGLVGCWFLFCLWVFRDPPARARFSRNSLLLAHWVPAALIAAYMMGFDSARTQMVSTSPAATFHLAASPQSPPVVEGRILRTFEKWFLLRDRDGQIRWVHSDNVLQIEGVQHGVGFRGILCRYWGRFCDTPPWPERRPQSAP